MAAFSAFSVSDALHTLSISIPEWNKKLEELNSQIALRQTELARLTEGERPPTRSVKNKGSTESLRPHDEETAEDLDNVSNPFDTPPKSDPNGKRQSQTATARSAAVVTPPLSNQRPSPTELSRKPSMNKPQQPKHGIRKRKTESMISAESQTPRYRTRSMIIVYYDSAVQTAFEDIVKFVSASRNSMRKGKMNAKMEAMRRAAEREVDEDAEEEPVRGLSTPRPALRDSKGVVIGGQEHARTPGTVSPPIEVADDEDDNDEIIIPQLKYVSTRNMGPPRGYGNHGMMGRNARIAAPIEVNDIFDELDKGLEWCQSQCERAAHQFLRDGDCSDEIEAIKKRLLSVKEKSDVEVERIKKEEVENPPAPRRDAGKSREMRSPQMRKVIGTSMKPTEINKKPAVAEKKFEHSQLEVGKMEVDEDEGYEEVDLPPVMTYRRTRDM